MTEGFRLVNLSTTGTPSRQNFFTFLTTFAWLLEPFSIVSPRSKGCISHVKVSPSNWNTRFNLGITPLFLNSLKNSYFPRIWVWNPFKVSYIFLEYFPLLTALLSEGVNRTEGIEIGWPDFSGTPPEEGAGSPAILRPGLSPENLSRLLPPFGV